MVRSLANGCHRALCRARRVVAMLAHPKAILEENPLIHLFGAIFSHFYQLDAFRDQVFLFACHFTGFTPPALKVVDG